MQPFTRRIIQAVLGAVAVAVIFGGGLAYANHRFSDVGTGTFYHESTDWLAEYEIANGFPDGTFQTGGNITRGQASFWLYNYNEAIKNVTNTVDPAAGTLFELTVSCPEGYRALGGGGSVNDSSVRMTASSPSFTIGGGQGWRIQFRTDSVTNPSQLVGYATCGPKT